VNTATIKGRRTLGDGRQLINICCPVCDGRHWLPAKDTAECPRRPGSFVIATDRRTEVRA
jgi:hypothetical protein